MPTNAEIPDFTQMKYREMLEALQRGTWVFLGAGVSALAGYPYWQELVEDICDKFIAQGLISDSYKAELLGPRQDNTRILGLLAQKNQLALKRAMEECFTIKPNLQYYAQFELLKQKYPNRFIQTNIDPSFEQYFSINNSEIGIGNKTVDESKSLNYIHGRIDYYDSWVFAEQSYNAAYDGASKIHRFLAQIFENYNVVFIGYSLKDKEILQILSEVKRKGLCKNHYAINGYKEHSVVVNDEIEFLEANYNVKMCPYKIQPEKSNFLAEVMGILNSELFNAK
jgi:NAD-dependent SIR2 family protein deacetylase